MKKLWPKELDLLGCTNEGAEFLLDDDDDDNDDFTRGLCKL